MPNLGAVGIVAVVGVALVCYGVNGVASGLKSLGHKTKHGIVHVVTLHKK